MSFDRLDQRMRAFETQGDRAVPPGVFIVARIDGRSFTRLTREQQDFDAPFDARFRDCMIATTRRLFGCGFGVVYGYTQSDEISLLLRRDDNTFGRKLRKLCSVLAGEASAAFTSALGSPGAFDCRVSQLPTDRDVIDQSASQKSSRRGCGPEHAVRATASRSKMQSISSVRRRPGRRTPTPPRSVRNF